MATPPSMPMARTDWLLELGDPGTVTLPNVRKTGHRQRVATGAQAICISALERIPHVEAGLQVVDPERVVLPRCAHEAQVVRLV
jgi:hypothetical protein